MYRVTRQIDFCYGHRLLNYAGKCKNLHGHNGRAMRKVSATDLQRLMAAERIGRGLRARLVRDGSTLALTVVPTELDTSKL